MAILLNVIKYILGITILVLVILTYITTTKEKYESFPYNEAKFYKSKENTFGIPVCKYQGMTPILTCSYDSRV